MGDAIATPIRKLLRNHVWAKPRRAYAESGLGIACTYSTRTPYVWQVDVAGHPIGASVSPRSRVLCIKSPSHTHGIYGFSDAECAGCDSGCMAEPNEGEE